MNEVNIVRTVNHDIRGRFIKGNCANPKGNNQFTYLEELKQALKYGKRKNNNKSIFFYAVERAYYNDAILIALLKKFIPDKIAGEGFGDTNINNYLTKIENKPTIIFEGIKTDADRNLPKNRIAQDIV